VRFTARVVGMLGAIVASLVLYVSDAGTAVVVGKHRVLAVLVSYGPRPFARASVAAALTEASTFLTRSSFGRLWLQTATTPWLEGGDVEPSCGASSGPAPATRQLTTTASSTSSPGRTAASTESSSETR
jgi:hypothetical protein